MFDKKRRVTHIMALFVALFSVLFLPSSLALYNDSHSKTVTIAVQHLPKDFSPYAAQPLAPQYAHLFFDPLVRWGKTTKLEKRLVQHWKIIKPGVVRFYLKDNITFHSGNILTSADIAWSYLQIKKSEKSVFLASAIKKIRIINRTQFDIYSDLSLAQLLDHLTYFFVLDKQFYAQLEKQKTVFPSIIRASDNRLVLSGTGPYQITQFNPKLVLQVSVNKKYWQYQKSSLALSFLKINAPKSRLYALLDNDIDISAAISNNNIKSVQFERSKELITVDSSRAFFLSINDKHHFVFENVNARKGISLAINQAGMLKHIANNIGRVNVFFKSIDPTPLILPKSAVSDYDVQAAKVLFKPLNMPKQLTLLTLKTDDIYRGEILNALVNMMKRVGLKLVISEVSSLDEWQRVFEDYDLTLSTWQTNQINNENVYQSLFSQSDLADYLQKSFLAAGDTGSLLEKVQHFQRLLLQHRVIALFCPYDIWGSDKKYSLKKIFSVNAIPYWSQLTLH